MTNCNILCHVVMKCVITVPFYRPLGWASIAGGIKYRVLTWVTRPCASTPPPLQGLRLCPMFPTHNLLFFLVFHLG